MSELGSILTGLTAKRKTPEGEGKHYIPFTEAEWQEMADAYGCAPDELKPKQLKNLLQAIAKGKVRLEKVTL